jgi:hypothetical protein
VDFSDPIDKIKATPFNVALGVAVDSKIKHVIFGGSAD